MGCPHVGSLHGTSSMGDFAHVTPGFRPVSMYIHMTMYICPSRQQQLWVMDAYCARESPT